MSLDTQHSASAGPVPSLSLAAILRLGLFQGCLGCLAVIFSGLQNRAVPAST